MLCCFKAYLIFVQHNYLLLLRLKLFLWGHFNILLNLNGFPVKYLIWTLGLFADMPVFNDCFISLCSLSTVEWSILLSLTTFLNNLELFQTYGKVASTAQRPFFFFFLEYRVHCHPDAFSRPDAWVCMSYNQDHTLPRQEVKVYTLLASHRPHPGFPNYPDSALCGKGSGSEQGLHLVICLSRLLQPEDQLFRFPCTWTWHSWRS